ncbi:MAG: energy-coupling factor transporter transmembrane protein EcfT [Clostridia bacterium]|nr:energy-coupling factor transporter transmembrane protein EcfT [Clostridia bacterium]
MNTSITIGQYIPLSSPIHRLDARIKLALTLLFIVTVFFAKSVLTYSMIFLFLALAVALSRIRVVMILKSLKPLTLVLIFTILINVFYARGEIVWQWWIFKIAWEGIFIALKMALRIILLVSGSSLLTYTTSPIMLTDAIEALLSPLKLFRVPVGELAMMMSIALRFIPTLTEETAKIMNAQKARGADFETGNLIKRAKALIPILVPLFVSAFRRADELAMAMESRAYTGGDDRTRLKPLKARPSDVAVLIGSILYFAACAVLGVLGY